MTTEVATIDEARDQKRKEALVKAIGFDKLPSEQREIAFEYARKYELDLLLRHVVIVEGKPYVTRDALLHVAHRSGQLDGYEVTDPVLEEMPGQGIFWRARCTVWRKDMSRPISLMGRYPSKGGNQRFAPEMAVKVAEVMTLRRAFDISAPAFEERWDIETPAAPEPAVPLREQVAARRAAITSAPSATPVEAGSAQAEVRDDPQGEPPMPVEAGALDVTPPRSETGNTIEGRTADEAGTMPAQCSHPSPYGDEKVCYLKAGHRNAHRSDVASWT